MNYVINRYCWVRTVWLKGAGLEIYWTTGGKGRREEVKVVAVIVEVPFVILVTGAVK